MPPPMTAILRRVTLFLPLSVTSGIRHLSVCGLVASGKGRRITAVASSQGVDDFPASGDRSTAEDVPERALEARVPERVTRRGQDRRPDQLARHRQLPGALGPEQEL